MLIAAFKPVEGGQWAQSFAPESFIEARIACVRPSPRGSSSHTAAWTASVNFFCEGGFEQEKLNGSLSEGRHKEFQVFNAALASGYVAKSIISVAKHRSSSLLV